jgi:hypothetical protein
MAEMSFEEVLRTDLRDTGGHQLLVVRATGVDGNYPAGGIVIDPDDLGFTEIVFMAVQSTVSFLDETTGVAVPFAWLSYNQIAGEWRAIVFVRGQDGTYSELPDGSPLSLDPAVAMSVMVIGHNGQ